ncbi:MAG: PucR family transcriptional regulator ligand-binding domain-containing protein [Treponema sp.]|nr:PucR family transcriptional regulator ligand-binding domain-containing protein [Treponema sp.]
MIAVDDILNLTLFKNFKLLAAKDYISNNVTTVVILEYESSKIEFSGYGNGYFVLASYFFASTAPDFVNNSLKLLIKRHVSGIAIKMSQDQQLPDDLIRLAEHEHVPIMCFHDEFMEDLIININESMKTRAQYIIQEEKLNRILEENMSGDGIRKIALEINPYFKNQIIVANLISREKSSNLKVHTFFDKLMYHITKKDEKMESWTFIKNGHDIILVCSFNAEDADSIEPISMINEILRNNDFDPESFYIGFSSDPVDIVDLKKSVIKAKLAGKVCQIEDNATYSYKETGVYKFIIPLIQNEIICDEIKNEFSALEEYDNAHDAQLIRTLTSFVKNNRDFNATGNDCYQHTNTIRYRIKKAMEILNYKEDSMNDEVAILIRCYKLLNSK